MKIVALDRTYWPRGGYGHWCPACGGGHEIDTEQPNSVGAKWSFDGNMESPTFSPSVNLRVNPKDHPKYNPDARSSVCHYNITAGQIIFHGDCTHAMRGQTVPLPDIPADKYLTSQRRGGS